MSTSFLYKLANPEPTLQPSTLLGCHTPGYFPSVLITSRPGTRQVRTVLHLKSLWNYSNWPILGLLTLPCLFLFSKTTVKALAYAFIPLLLPPDWHWGFPCVAWGAPCSWELGVTTLLLMAVVCWSAGLTALEWEQNLCCKTLSSSLASFPAILVSILFLKHIITLLSWGLCFRILSAWKVVPDFSFVKFLISFWCLPTTHLFNEA